MAPSRSRRYLPAIIALGALLPPAAEPDERSRLSALLDAGADSGFLVAGAPRRFEFPADHGPHPGYRNEWWYLTGNLDSEGGRRFGYELTIFRFALTPAAPDADSEWRTNQIFIAHFAVTDAEADAFHVAERYSRGALGLAGATSDPFRVWIDDWTIASAGSGGQSAAGREHWRHRAASGDMSLELELAARKPPALNGEDGLSRKSAEPGNASYYYSISRWQSAGTLALGDRRYAVSGLSWLDREWSSSALAADQQGWDWFALQLDDGSELMFYNLRKTDGSQDAFSAGTWIAADGSTRYLGRDDVELVVTDHWQSPAGGRYPAGWRLHAPAHELRLAVTPVIANQELFTTVRYWEGAVDVRGTRAGAAVSGRGYVELTGYAGSAASDGGR